MYMTQPDRQRIQHIRDYCEEIRKTIERYGEGFAVFDQDADYQRSIAFSILQIGELRRIIRRIPQSDQQPRAVGTDEGNAKSCRAQLRQYEPRDHLGDRGQ